MNGEASLINSIPLLDTIETSTLTRSPTTPPELDNAPGWRDAAKDKDTGDVDVEKFPQGYPRYSALLSADHSFQIWRRFSILRTRLLLLKQDELSQLEEQLENIDAKDHELLPLYLGNNREDMNQDRKRILKEINTTLSDYDSLLNRQHQIFNVEPALDRSILNLQNWHYNNCSVSRNETKYLYREDLISLLGNNSPSYRVIDAISPYLATRKEGKDMYVAILTESTRQIIQILLRALQAALTAVLLFTPVIICNFVSNLTYRMIIIVATTAIFMAILSCIALKRMKLFEMVIAGTTYATVLVVFISGTNATNN